MSTARLLRIAPTVGWVALAGTAVAAPPVAVSTAAAKAPATRFEVSLSTQPFEGPPLASFSCRAEKVYVRLLRSEKVSGRHVLEGRWFKPGGGLQERTRVPLDLKPPGEDRFHLWIEFHLVQDIVDMLRTRTEEEEFDGEWTVDVFWDGKKVASRKFRVVCG